MRRIIFSTLNKKKWIENIVFSRQFINENIQLEFSESILESKLLPVHLVTLACLIDEYNKSGKKVYLFSKNNDLIKYLIEDLRFNAHLKLNDYNQIDELVSENVFYLWRVKNDEKDLYPRRVEDYFRRISFQEKDLSPISEALVEVYYNIFDHAGANGNAFSLLKYNSETKILSVAVSDFGKGIAKSIRDNAPNIENDCIAIEKAIQDNYTVKSQRHNRGLGLGNILSCTKITRILCNQALLISNNYSKKIFLNDFEFLGTLIYFEIDINQLEQEEYLTSFQLNDF